MQKYAPELKKNNYKRKENDTKIIGKFKKKYICGRHHASKGYIK